MSNIHNLVLVTDINAPEVVTLNEWLVSKGHNPLEKTSDDAGGNRVMECDVYMGAYSRFKDTFSEFITLFQSTRWKVYENIVLVVEPPEGDMGVYRPDEYWVTKRDE